MDVMQLRRSLLMQMIGGSDMGVWTQKTITLQSAISLADGFKNLMDANVPSGTSLVIIAKDDWTQHINNQLMAGFYAPSINNANGWERYRNNDYNWLSGAGAATWTNTYALTASAGDKYTLFYQ